MKEEYLIAWAKPDDFDGPSLMQRMPSPISGQMTEIYNYSFREDGFYFVDNLVDPAVAGYAMKLFIDAALAHSETVTVHRLPKS